MRLLADENVHGKVVSWLRERGHPVEWVRELSSGAEDAALLTMPDMANTVFITNDRDFGELIFRQGLISPLAILYTRTEHRSWRPTAELIADELERGVTPGQIATITVDGVRRRTFPTRSDRND